MPQNSSPSVSRMFRVAINELSTYRWTFEEDVMHYRQAGFNALGVWRAKLADFGEEKGIELLREQGMRVSSLQWIGGFTGTDCHTVRESFHDGLDAIQLAADLKADCVVVVSGSRRGHIEGHATRMFTSVLRDLAEAAEAVGINLAVEPMHAGCAFDWTFLNDIPRTLDVITEVGRSNVGIVFDSYHMAQEEAVLAWLPSIVPLVRLVQLGDAKHAPLGEQNRCLLGHGKVPVAEIVSEFEKHGYQGFYEIELCGEEIEHLDYLDVIYQSKTQLAAWLPEPSRAPVV